MSAQRKQGRTDWKSVSVHLFRALNMCMNHMKAPVGSTGCIGSFDKETGSFNSRHWREIVADALEKFPGCTVDREACHALDLPKRQREQFIKERIAAKKGVPK